MDLEAARSALASEIKAAQAETNLDARFLGARRLVTAAGIEALQIQYSNGLSLGDVLLHAVSAPRTPDRRSFAVLVIDALELFAEVGDGRKGRAAYRGGVLASTSPLKE